VLKELTPEDQLRHISKAWGGQTGWCFFPWIAQPSRNREERIKNYHEGPAFMWPKDRERILTHIKDRSSDDLYWCPSLFEKDQRKMELAMDEHCLWADLDEVDPREIKDYPPTIAWESSPGRYQALWLISGGLMGASWQGNENQRLTYHLGADPGGWDTTQLLRLPGWRNRKFQHGAVDEGVPGQLLWTNGRRYTADDFEDLPEVASVGQQVTDILEEEIARVDRFEVWGRVRLKVSSRTREFFSAREAEGDRSSVLWEIERELADAGCSVVEIVAVVRGTVWNKYEGRGDELRRLTTEAAKAIAEKDKVREATGDASGPLEPAAELEVKPDAQDLWTLLAAVKPPQWLVKDVLAVGACGFIAGQPKTHKSWIGLDLMLSVASGIPFLDHFRVVRPGPVLYIQEEDSAPMVKGRMAKVWPGKIGDKMVLDADGDVAWHPPDDKDRPAVNAVIREGVVISDPGWQAWLDDQLVKGKVDAETGERRSYAMVLIDPLMMVAGEVEENRSQQMTTKIFKPLKTLAEKHEVAIVVIHHMRKGDANGQRGGQMMLGSIANHAWAEDSLYISTGRGGVTVVERESKHTASGSFKIKGLKNRQWTPQVTDASIDFESDDETPPRASTNGHKRRAHAARSNGHAQTADRPNKTRDALKALGRPATAKELKDLTKLSYQGVEQSLKRGKEAGTVEWREGFWVWVGA
jgi:hypothetical protein